MIRLVQKLQDFRKQLRRFMPKKPKIIKIKKFNLKRMIPKISFPKPTTKQSGKSVATKVAHGQSQVQAQINRSVAENPWSRSGGMTRGSRGVRNATGGVMRRSGTAGVKTK